MADTGGWVVVGTSQHALDNPSLPSQISSMVNQAYGYPRLGESETRQRLSMGDAGNGANRVLHLAFRLDENGAAVLVGCCSSTVQPPWTERGCGHWGLLVCGRPFQGSGVGSLLVAAAEARLIDRRCSEVQIEYEYTAGDPYSERLAAWYEGKCGFGCGHPIPTMPGDCQFRRCRKRLLRRMASRPPTEDGLKDACPEEGRREGTARKVCPALRQTVWWLLSRLLPLTSNAKRLRSPFGSPPPPEEDETTAGEGGRESASRGVE